MGTPDFARTVLQKVLEWPGGTVTGVYTQPDRPSGRGRKVSFPPVKELALERGLPVLQPHNFKSVEEVRRLEEFDPHYLVVAAYGLILPPAVLDTAAEMPINVHASLLPLYRGAAPIQRAIIDGQSQTGISIMRLTPGMDEGPVLMEECLDIQKQDTAQTLHDKLADLGGKLVVKTLEKLQHEKIVPVEQDHAKATYAGKLTKKEGDISWDRPAQEIHDRIRGMFPWPGAFFNWKSPAGKTIRLKVYPGRTGGERPPEISPGTLVGLVEECLCIACQDRMYLTPTVKPENSKEMSARSFYCGFMQKCRE